ncbi:MAG: hypothetical protein V1660_01580 [archaeon]
MATKKKSFDVEIPMIDTIIKLSALEIENLNNKTIKMDLTRQLHGKSIEAVFRISVKDGKATADLKGFKLLPFYIQRAIRKGISYVEDSFMVPKDDVILRIKPFMITRKSVHRSVRNALRLKAAEEIKAFCESKSIEEIVSSIIYGRYAKELSLKLKKIYPLSFCEIRIFEILKKKEQ